MLTSSSGSVVDSSCPSRAEATAVRFDSMLCLRRGCAAWPFPALRPNVKLARFPEENTTLAVDRQTGDGVDYGSLGTRERLFRRIVAKLLRAGYLQRLVPVDDLLPCLYTRHAVAGQERPDLDQLFADAPRLHALTVRPSLAWERPGVSDTENSKLATRG